MCSLVVVVVPLDPAAWFEHLLDFPDYRARIAILNDEDEEAEVDGVVFS
jgi:hypothetical protein